MRAVLTVSTLILLLSIIPPNSFAESTLSVNTNKPYYKSGQCILVSGIVSDVSKTEPALIQIFDSMGNLVEIRQVNVENEKTFQFIVKPYTWQNSGEYTLKIFHLGQTNQTTFNLSSQHHVSTTPPLMPIKLDNNSGFQIHHYNKITHVNPEERSISFTIGDDWDICKSGDRILEIDFIRSFVPLNNVNYTTKLNQTDEFLVLVNNTMTSYNVTSYPGNSHLTIPISWHAVDVKIQITKTVPEFGLASLILVTSMIATIILLSRSKFKF